ncbi:hypothetical protein E3N88_29539 [Mikania micrantha]|uniref:Uncharacterized protein n=1 Tax=Mikania micrantha TaxID=192012 RepID=A0A5N6MJS0_9ASTR|nr:hypothetical protein E3N88_29539 [Mikania micrantha]
MIQNLTCVIQNHRREPPLSLWSHEQNTHIDERCVYCLTARTKERTRVAGRKWLLASKLPEEPGGGGDKEKLTTMKPSFFASSLVSTGLPKEPTIPRRSSGMHDVEELRRDEAVVLVRLAGDELGMVAGELSWAEELRRSREDPGLRLAGGGG